MHDYHSSILIPVLNFRNSVEELGISRIFLDFKVGVKFTLFSSNASAVTLSVLR